MKQIFTLFVTGILCLSIKSTFAQFSQNFDGGLSSLNSNCWSFTNVLYTQQGGNPDYVINGTGSIYTEPPVSATDIRVIKTPFLNVSSSSLSVSFLHKLTSKVNGNSTRTIEVGIENSAGTFTSLQSLTLDKNSPTSTQTWNGNYTVTPGVYRVVIRIGGATGDGNTRVVLDDLSVNATPYYSGGCNPVATAVNDEFFPGTIAAYTGSLQTNDNIPTDGETYTYQVVAAPSTGSLTLNSNGDFTYTPDPAFTGGPVTFTYNIIDNGTPAATSNTATVTINFPEPQVLPVTLISFSGNINGGKVKLVWKVADNEEARKFEVERSVDGKDFTTAGVVFSTDKAGEEWYSFSETVSASRVSYRLKMIDKDGKAEYSKILFLGTQSAPLAKNLSIINNPVTTSLVLSYNSHKNSPVAIQIYNEAGALIYNNKLQSNTGVNQFIIDANVLRRGTYIVQVVNDLGERSVVKAVKL